MANKNAGSNSSSSSKDGGVGSVETSSNEVAKSAPRPKLTIYLDVVSPFSYLAFYVTRHSGLLEQCEISYVPIQLGKLFDLCGNRTPMVIHNKDKWTDTERMRAAKNYRIPMLTRMPDPFPQPTQNTQRALCAVIQLYPEKLPDAFAALFQAFWVDGKRINRREIIRNALLVVMCADDVDTVMATIDKPEVQELLMKNTEQAFEKGAFGLPWFVAENAQGQEEVFWGVDRLNQVLDHLGLKRDGRGPKALL